MANIFISFSHVLYKKSNAQGVFPVFYDLFISKLIEFGNNVYYMDSNPMSTNIEAPSNKNFLKPLHDIKPDLIILFNNRFPKIDLSKHFDCPVCIYGVDTVLLYSNKEILKTNSNYKYIVCSSEDITLLKEQFNVSEDRVLKIPFFTGVNAEEKPIQSNISFIGSQWCYPNLVEKFMSLHPSDDEVRLFQQMVQEVKENPFLDESILKSKYSELSDKVASVININQTLWHISSLNRVKVLSSIASLGLKIYGPASWSKLNYYPEISLSYSPKLIHSVKDNQDCYNSSKIGISMSHAQSIDTFPWRITDIMASNACLVTDYHSDFEKYFPGIKIPVYKSPHEARQICEYLLKNEAERKDIVKQCNAVINDKYRFENYLPDIERFLNIKLDNKLCINSGQRPVMSNLDLYNIKHSAKGFVNFIFKSKKNKC